LLSYLKLNAKAQPPGYLCRFHITPRPKPTTTTTTNCAAFMLAPYGVGSLSYRGRTDNGIG
jgi:hypothetical protein